MKKELRVPYFKQKKDYTCGPASLKMVLRFFGMNEREDAISRNVKTNENGTRHMPIINFARKKGFYCFVHEGSGMNHIKHFIDQGLPVIVNYIEPSSNEGHYSVVVGYNDNSVIMRDPWNGKEFKVNKDSFIERWHDSHKGYKCSRWILVLSKKEFDIGKKYNPL